jgi:type III secretion protein C
MLSRRIAVSCGRVSLGGQLALALMFCVSAVFAAPVGTGEEAGPEVPWTERRTALQVENIEIADLLRQIASANGLSVQIDERIKGTISGRFSASPQSVFNRLSRKHGFQWFFDGNSLVVSPAGDVKTEMIRLSAEAMNQLKATMRQLRIYDPRFPIREDRENRLTIFSGPSRYVDMLLGVARGLQDSVDQRAPTEVLVYPLKYAWAEDRTAGGGGGSVVVPGVVSVLKGIYRQNDERSSITASASLGRPRARRSLSTGVDRGSQYSISDRGGADDGQTVSVRQTVSQMLQAAGASPNSPTAHTLPVIVADARRNAVIVRDLAERLPKHRALLQELDTRAPLVEIEAQIIDVRTDELESLGLDWRLAGRRADVQIGSGGPPLGFSATLAGPSTMPTLPTGGQFTIIAGNAAAFLMARIGALEGSGKARTVATPRVTTMDNVPSVMSTKESFYVRVPGAYASDLFEVSSGVSLSVLPFVVQESESVSVRLAINISDGSVDPSTQVDNIPTTQQSEISAEAIVRDGASLLIAGYAREEESSSHNGVPVLSRLPGLGALFQHRNSRGVRQERLFLVTPRIVQP